MLNSFWQIDSGKFNRRSSDLGLSEKGRTMPLEVFAPHVYAWVEEGDEVVGCRVILRDVAAFGIVTSSASPTQIVERSRAVVLPRADVVRLVR